MYVYQADTYCDSCGERLIADHLACNLGDEGDSDGYPQWASDDEECDSPDHCASGAACLEGIDLSGYGLAPDATLYGAESRIVGAIVSGALTDEGESYTREMMAEPDATPYQAALYRVWREAFDV